MEIKHQSIILDVNKANILPNIIAHQGDQKTRFIDVTLTMSGEELILNDSYRAILKASNNGEVKAINDCEIDLEQNIIIVELTSTMLDTAGFLNCEITVVDEDKYITSQNFLVEVSLSTVSDEDEIETSKEYGTLVRLMNEVSKIESDAKVVKDIISHLAEITDIDALVNSKADKETVEKELAKKADTTDLDTKENISNKINTINFPSTTYYPSSKAVWDYVNSKNSTLINDIENLKNNKVNITDFNIFKDSTNSNISTNSTNIENLKNELAEKNKKINDLSIKVTTDKAGNTTISDSSNNNIVGLNMYGKTTQSTTPTPTNPVAIKDINNPKITVTNDSDSQSINIQCTLRGIGNVCDTLTVNSDGTGYITQNLQQLVLQSSDFDKLKESPSGTNTHRCTLTFPSAIWANSSVKYVPLCNVLQFFAFAGTEKYPCFDIRTNTLYVDLGLSLIDTKATLKNCADENNGIILVGVKQTPTVLNLTKEQINEFLNLHTYYPSTTVVSDCDSQLTYIADTKNYIDNKFNELATAIVAHESEVM